VKIYDLVMDKINITIIQTNLEWENSAKNLIHFSEKINDLNEPTDLIVLPEMFTTGFSMNPRKLAEQMDGATVRWMRDIAVNKNIFLLGSFIIRENKNYYNRLVWMPPDGAYTWYDKRHLFRMEDEHNFYTSGNQILITKIGHWKFRPLICYDLRFPVWIRNHYNYDVLVFIANWPEPRREVWKILLKARAIENQVYVIGVNRIGSDGREINYSGDSMVINPRGEVISKTLPSEEFPVHLDADKFEII
jgi:omega-amidase